MCLWCLLGTTAEFAVRSQTFCCPSAGTLFISSCCGLSCLWFLKYLYFERETKYFLSDCTSLENYKSFQNQKVHEHTRHFINYVYVHSPVSHPQVCEMAQRKFTYLLSAALFLFEFFLKPRTIVYIFINAGILLWLCKLNSLINPAYSSFFCWHSILGKSDGKDPSPMPQLLVCEICSPLSFSYPLLQIYQHLLNICYKYWLVYGWPVVGAQKSNLFSQGPDQK